MEQQAQHSAGPHRVPLRWGQRWNIALVVASAGAVYGFFMLLPELRSVDDATRGGMLGLWLMIGAAGLGALLAGALCAPLFGHSGPLGWARACLGWLLASLLGGAIGGTLIVPIYGTLFGPLLVFGYMTVSPGLFPLWLVLLVPVHLRARQVRDGDEILGS